MNGHFDRNLSTDDPLRRRTSLLQRMHIDGWLLLILLTLAGIEAELGGVKQHCACEQHCRSCHRLIVKEIASGMDSGRDEGWSHTNE